MVLRGVCARMHIRSTRKCSRKLDAYFQNKPGLAVSSSETQLTNLYANHRGASDQVSRQRDAMTAALPAFCHANTYTWPTTMAHLFRYCTRVALSGSFRMLLVTVNSDRREMAH